MSVFVIGIFTCSWALRLFFFLGSYGGLEIVDPQLKLNIIHRLLC
jgi:hypothetical protein